MITQQYQRRFRSLRKHLYQFLRVPELHRSHAGHYALMILPVGHLIQCSRLNCLKDYVCCPAELLEPCPDVRLDCLRGKHLHAPVGRLLKQGEDRVPPPGNIFADLVFILSHTALLPSLMSLKNAARYFPVGPSVAATSSGVPFATRSPPLRPPSGPRSII